VGYSYSREKLRQGADDVVSPLDMRALPSKEAQERKKKISQSILAGFQDALSPHERLPR
jgi:hypothetical protein